MSNSLKAGLCAAAICVTMLLAQLPVVADTLATMTTAMGTYGSLQATVSRNGNLYHYEYVFTSVKAYNGFGVGNLFNLDYYSAGSNNAGNVNGNGDPLTPAYFSGNPVHGATGSSITWNAILTPPTTTVSKFWYDSPWRYSSDINVTISGGGAPRQGKTLGMIPEPASFGSMLAGVSGFGLLYLRSLKRRRR